MYNDYSVDEMQFHAQSQSTTSETSKTGQRYIHHVHTGGRILMFVREYRSEHGQTAPYMFLGNVTYLRHEGSRPMNIVWELSVPIPARFLRKTNKLMHG